MAKPTEKMLYQTFLDLFFAAQSLKGSIEEISETLKDLKSASKKIDKNLELAKNNYKELYGSLPREPK
jgi:hypothetical protein